jgi:hypothetical protein
MSGCFAGRQFDIGSCHAVNELWGTWASTKSSNSSESAGSMYTTGRPRRVTKAGSVMSFSAG